MRRFVLLLALNLLAGLPAARAAWYEREEAIMGTRIQVELWADDAAGVKAIDAVMADMRRIDAAMSTYRSDSELSRLNARAAREPVTIGAELFGLLQTSMEFSRLTDGAFDVTYASVGFMYDFRARRRPTEAQIQAALPEVNYRLVTLDAQNRTVRYGRKACASTSAASPRATRWTAASRCCRRAASGTPWSRRAATAA